MQENVMVSKNRSEVLSGEKKLTEEMPGLSFFFFFIYTSKKFVVGGEILFLWTKSTDISLISVQLFYCSEMNVNLCFYDCFVVVI